MEKAVELVKNQRCVVCGKFGCKPFEVTVNGGGRGDNIMPLCGNHVTWALVDLFYKHQPKIRSWLLEHERLDVVKALEGMKH